MAIEKVREYFRQFDTSSATVELATEALKCAPERIAKTLSFQSCDGCILIVAERIFCENKDLFKIAYGCDNYLFSHAGVSRDWLKFRKDKLQVENETATEIANALNQLTFTDEENVLWDIRGHYGVWTSGPLWIRDDELLGLYDYHVEMMAWR